MKIRRIEKENGGTVVLAILENNFWNVLKVLTKVNAIIPKKNKRPVYSQTFTQCLISQTVF